MAQADTYTRWGVVASGEGGNNVAVQMFERADNPGIEERITLLNTNRTDIGKVDDRAEIAGDLGEHTHIFGAKGGVGNDTFEGERQTEKSIDQIAATVDDNAIDADAFLYLSTLGGGTGNGSVPYLVQQFGNQGDAIDRTDYGPWVNEAKHFALAIWPYGSEGAQRQFNAMCGMSRLLMKEQTRSQNADMTLLVSNSHVDPDEQNGKQWVNSRILDAIDLMIGAGREGQRVVDVEDYVAQPSDKLIYHFTPALKMGANSRMMEWDLIFDQAAQNSFVPMDPATADAAYAVVRAPKRAIENAKRFETPLKQAFQQWRQKHDIKSVSFSTLIPTNRRGNDIDVLLLLGGFDLNPLVEPARDAFKHHIAEKKRARNFGNSESNVDRIRRIEENLDAYIEYHAE